MSLTMWRPFHLKECNKDNPPGTCPEVCLPDDSRPYHVDGSHQESQPTPHPLVNSFSGLSYHLGAGLANWDYSCCIALSFKLKHFFLGGGNLTLRNKMQLTSLKKHWKLTGVSRVFSEVLYPVTMARELFSSSELTESHSEISGDVVFLWVITHSLMGFSEILFSFNHLCSCV